MAKGNDDASSYAIPIDEHPDLDLSLLALEVDTKQKKISSTEGMKLAQTSLSMSLGLKEISKKLLKLNKLFLTKTLPKLEK